MSDTEVTTLVTMLETSESLAKAAQLAQVEYEASLQAIVSAHGATFTDPRNNQVYQVRTRKDSTQGRPITYLCALKAEPKTWLTGRTKKDTTANPTETPTVPETGGATVID